MAEERLQYLIDAVWRGGSATQQASASIGGVGKASQKATKSTGQLQGMLAKFGTAAVLGGIALAGNEIRKFANESVDEFEDFEKQSAEVFTLLPDASATAMAQMRADVTAFGSDVGRLSGETVPALYQAISAGVPRENAFEFLQTASDAALGGVTELETAVDGISSVVNAYGADVIDAGRASDLMFTAVRGGKTTFDELSRSLFNVIPNAASLDVEFGNVTAALATMTAQGTPTATATTQLRQMLVELSKAGSEVAGTFEDAAGRGFRQFIAEGGNLQEALQILEEHAAASGMSISDLFSSVEAGSAALSLTGASAQKFTGELEAAAQAAGATAEAAAQMEGTLAHSRSVAEATGEEFKILVGKALAPTVQAYLDIKSAILGAANEHMREQNAIKATDREADELIDTLLELNDAHDTTGQAVERINAMFGAEAGNMEDARARSAALTAALELLELGFEGNGHQLAETAISIGENEHATRLYTNEIIANELAQHQAQKSTQQATEAYEEQGETLSEAEQLAQNYNLAGRDTVGVSGDMRRAAHEVTQEYQEQKDEAAATAEATAAYEQALRDAEAALGSYFEEAIEGKDVNEDLLGQFLSLAAQQGANADELRHIAQATGDYSEAEIEAAVSAATLHTEFAKVTEAWEAGKSTAEETTEAINLLEQGEADTAEEALALARVFNADVPEGLASTQESALDTKLGIDDMSEAMDEVPGEVTSVFEDENTYVSHFEDAQRLLDKLNQLDGKSVTSTHTLVTNRIQEETGYSGGPEGGPGLAQGGSFVVPPGFANDTFPFRASSGERVTVETPAQQASGGDTIYNINVIVDGRRSEVRGAGESEADPLLRAARQLGVPI